MFVVLNPTPAVISEIGSKSSPIFGALEFKSPYSNFYTANDFVMSSTVGVLKTLAVQTNEQALANPIDVAVQRNLAKVAVLSSNVSNGTFTTSAGHTASGLTFAPITRAINSYLIQQKNAGTSEIVTPGAAIVPEKDNNYWANTTAPLAAEYETVGVMAASNPDPKSYKCFYALENVNDKNYVGNTTAAIIKANMKLKDGTVVTGYTAGTRTFGNLAANQSFYVLKGDNTPWSEAAYTAALASTDFTAAHFTLKYDGGVSYYRIWVKDANDVVAIIRNNYYIMQMNSISGIGSPIPPGTGNEVNPEDPIDEDTYISVKVSVQNWSTIVTGHDL